MDTPDTAAAADTEAPGIDPAPINDTTPTAPMDAPADMAPVPCAASDDEAAPADDIAPAQAPPDTRQPTSDRSAADDEADATEAVLPDDSFATLGLAEPVARAVADLGYETATAVQVRCIPPLLAGRDVLGQAQTGTGKTAAFALPLLSRLDPSTGGPQVLVLTPTRELALQVAEAFQRYAHNLPGFHVAPVYGGQSYGLQVRQLQRAPQVIVGTPGRVMDHLRRGTLVLDDLKALVLDEADEMLNLGFAEDIDWIFEQTPPERQVALFSATMPPGILKVAREHLDDPVEVRIESAHATVSTIDQQHLVVTRFHKADILTRILELETFDGMLIFVRTKGGTTELVDKLRSQGFAADALNGDMNQEMRERTVERLKSGQLDILVATDVAARGLDVERISHVVNFDIPTDPSAYVHRIGRTGRAGRAGKAILLVEPRERGLLRSIERTIRRQIPEMATPSAEQLSASRIERFTAQLRETLAEQDLDFFYRLISRISKDQELELLDIAAAASYLIQRERPLDVKEPPAPPRRPRHEGGFDQPRRPRDDRRDTRPPRGDRGERGERGPGPRFEPRGDYPGPGPDRERAPRRDDRDYQDDNDRQPTQVPYQGVRARTDEYPYERERARQEERGRFPREGGERRDDRDFRPPRREPGRESNRGESWDDDRGNRDPRFERPRRTERPERPDRPERPAPRGPGDYQDDRRPPRERGGRDQYDLVDHRIEVGHRDGVTPREIVGAIANESGLEGRYIGHIDIRDDHAIVGLPGGMPREIFQHLKHVYVCGKELQISVLEGGQRQSRPPRDRNTGAPPRPPRRDRDDSRGPAPRHYGSDDRESRGPRSDGPRSDQGGFRRKPRG